jgi:hypothetical protein
MNIVNIHERVLQVDPAAAGALIDSLSSSQDRLWPKQLWPRMRFDRELGVGAQGGHGPIRYFVEKYTPGKAIRFRFTGPRGFDGFHAYEIEVCSEHEVVLRHSIRMKTHGRALLTWPVAYRPMHDALMEDSLAIAQLSLGLTPRITPWHPWVRLLRWLVSGGRAPSQNRLSKY